MPSIHPLKAVAAATIIIGLAGCTVAPPSGPTVVAMPGQGKSFAAFQHDDRLCRGYASEHVNPAEAQAAGQNANTTAVAGTLLGAATGALLGAAGGNAGMGAAAGGGAGLLLGSSMAGNQAQGAANSMQARYNVAYAQCMVAHGNRMEGYMNGAGPGYGYPYQGY